MRNKMLLRCLVALLCLTMCALAMFSCTTTPSTGDESSQTPSGSGSGEESTTGGSDAESVKISIADYAIVCPERCSDGITQASSTLNMYAKNHLGNFFGSVKTDDLAKGEKPDPDAKEILIGMTNREESSAAMKNLTKAGYVIQMIGNKIVINGTMDELIQDAVEYFLETYVSPTKGDMSFYLPKDLNDVQGDIGAAVLVGANGKFNFEVIYSDSLDSTENPNQTTSSMKDRLDYTVESSRTLMNSMMETFGTKIRLSINSDAIPYKESKCEILIGMTNRPETKEFLSRLSPNQYGFGLVNNKIVIAGWAENLTVEAVAFFNNMVTMHSAKDVFGNENYILFEGLDFVTSNPNWDVTIPAYQDGNFVGVQEGLGSAFEYYYTGTNETEYKAYCNDLESKGYKLHQSNEIAGNLFATYYNDKAMIHVYFVKYLSAVRLVTEPIASATLPQNTDPGMGPKITETTFTMMDLDFEADNFGNSFIMTLEDGSFIIHDGGADRGGDDCLELYKLLKKLNKREDGKIVIAAWMLSHEHYDHFKNFYDLIMKYGGKDGAGEIVLERVIYNQAPSTVTYNSGNPGSYIKNGQMSNIQKKTGCKLVKMHTGQKIQIRNVTFEVLFTFEDLYPETPFHFNDTSFFGRYYVDGCTMTITGDIEDMGSGVLCKMYGEALKTDILQVAHHGWGGTTQLYALCKPTIVLWPTEQGNVNSQLSGSGYYPETNQSLINQKNVKLLIVADGGHKTFAIRADLKESDIIVWEPERPNN